MTDVVERLREIAAGLPKMVIGGDDKTAHARILEAAAEIVRLREEVTRLRETERLCQEQGVADGNRITTAESALAAKDAALQEIGRLVSPTSPLGMIVAAALKQETGANG